MESFDAFLAVLDDDSLIRGAYLLPGKVVHLTIGIRSIHDSNCCFTTIRFLNQLNFLKNRGTNNPTALEYYTTRSMYVMSLTQSWLGRVGTKPRMRFLYLW